MHHSSILDKSNRSTRLFSYKILNAYFIALCVVGLCTLLSGLIASYVDSSNLIMIYLLGVVIVATCDNKRHGPAMLAALTSTLAFDFFFVPPYFSFNVSDIQYFITLVVMLVVTQIISHLTIRIQRHIDATQHARMQAESERLRNILLASISHDLRTPLTAIMGSASSLLQPEHLNEIMRRELAKNIFDESKRLNKQVTNVLQVIRLEARSVKINKERYLIDEIISHTLERLSETLGDKKVSVHIARNMPFIPLDHMLIEQVLCNLIENAIKYSPAKSPIEIFVRMSGKNALIKIMDHGAGLPETDLQQIFDKFYRGKNVERNDAGFGLGLAICKNIIQAHGGKIWAENHQTGGAIFYFTLPM